jgi:hypothetical protein
VPINIDELQPTISGGEIWYFDPGADSDKVYRGHLTHIEGEGWVAWVEHGRRGYRQRRSAVTKSAYTGLPIATSLHHALAELNKRIQSKQRASSTRGAYEGWGQISRDDLRAIGQAA